LRERVPFNFPLPWWERARVRGIYFLY